MEEDSLVFPVWRRTQRETAAEPLGIALSLSWWEQDTVFPPDFAEVEFFPLLPPPPALQEGGGICLPGDLEQKETGGGQGSGAPVSWGVWSPRGDPAGSGPITHRAPPPPPLVLETPRLSGPWIFSCELQDSQREREVTRRPRNKMPALLVGSRMKSGLPRAKPVHSALPIPQSQSRPALAPPAVPLKTQVAVQQVCSRPPRGPGAGPEAGGTAQVRENTSETPPPPPSPSVVLLLTLLLSVTGHGKVEAFFPLI